MTVYDDGFFAGIEAGARASAAVVAPILVDALKPSSIIDVGCATGTWLSAFRAAGVTDVLGVDGSYVDRSALEIPADCFRPLDLNQPFQIGRRFDLAISLEVAEHLFPERSSSFVADLVTLAPIVCFGAAIPMQGGTDHVNERWQEAWVEMFAAHDYRPVDLLRRRVWDHPDVQPWYAQNTLVYASPDTELAGEEPDPLSVVHPRLFEQRVRKRTRPLGPRELIREARRTARQRLR